ncbi:hypothetical protein AALB16_08215 [Lachnospiraceae bacterium 62-35]
MKDSLDRQYKINIILNIVFKLLTIALALISVNAYLKYLGNRNYGLWITISSISSWAAIGDLGIGNGLRNQLAKAYSDNDIIKQNELIEASLSTMLKLSGVIFVVLTFITEVMICLSMFQPSIRWIMYITNLFMCINFILGIVKSIAYAYQESWMASFSQFNIYLLGIIFVYTLIFFKQNTNLLLFAFLNGCSGIIANIILLVQLKCKYNIPIRIKKNVSTPIINSILSLGLQFFVLQLSCLILYSTDNVIINTIIGSNAVTKYSIITRIYTTGDGLFSILLISMWSAVTYQWEKKNYVWIRDKVRNMLIMWLLYSGGVVVVSILLNRIVNIWLGNSAIVYERNVITLFAFYNIAGAFGSIFVNVANGIGVIQLQMILAAIEAVINIPLSIFFARNCEMGILGVKLATLLCCTGANVVIPIQIYLLLKSKTRKCS